MGSPASFNVAPAPVDSPFTTDPKTGCIDSPAWLAWLTRTVFPVLTVANDAQTSIETLLELGAHGGEATGGELALPLPLRGVSRETSQFPPQVSKSVPSNEFPPRNARAYDIGAGLALLAATPGTRTQLIWIISDTLANQGKYPNSAFPLYSLFVASDKKLVYYNTGTAWVQVPDVPASATVLASNSDHQIIAAPLADADIWIGSGSNLPVAKALSGDATLADTGVLTLANTAVTPTTYGDATHVGQFTVDSKGRLTFAANVAITFPGTSGFTGTAALAALTALGAQGSITFANGLATGYSAPT